MRPASYIDDVTYGSAVLWTRNSVYGGPWSTWLNSGDIGGPSYWNRAITPTGVDNPVQPDGSRARSAWSNQFASLAVPFVNCLTEADTPWGDKVQYRILAPVLPDNSIRLAVGKVSPASMGDFPYEVEARARSSFLKKLAGSTAQLGVTLAEMKQTVGLTRSLAEDILKGIDKSIRAGRNLPRQVVREIVNFGKLPKKFPREKTAAYNRRIARERAVLDKWLETQFGLKPLVSDIDEIGRGLSDLLFEQELPMELTITSGAKINQYVEFTGESTPVFAGCTVDGWGDTTVKCHISADYEVPLSQSRTWNQWGLANPASLVWEVTQFSWLVDYVFQVGDWLESLTASTGVIPLGGSISRLAKLERMSTRIVPSGFMTVIQPSGWVPISVHNVGWFDRSLVSEVHPSLRPTIRNKLDLTRLANVLSVLAQRKNFH